MNRMCDYLERYAQNVAGGLYAALGRVPCGVMVISSQRLIERPRARTAHGGSQQVANTCDLRT